MVDDVRAHLERVPDEVGAVVARVGVPLKRVLERVERRGREAALVDVRERAAEAAEADAEEVVIVRRGAELRDERDGVQAAAVVVDLPLDALELPAVDVVPGRTQCKLRSKTQGRRAQNSPVATCVPVVAPVRDCWLVRED